MNFTPSSYQQDIFSFIESGTGNALVNAVAGSGKSTTLREIINRIPDNQSVLNLAFNKSIVEELKKKIGYRRNVQTMTLHGLGVRAIMAFDTCSVNADKYTAYINQQFKANVFKPTKPLEDQELAEYKSNINKLTDLIRLSLVRSYKEAEELAFKHDLFLHDNELEVVSIVIKWGRENRHSIDFTDMIYFPNVFKLPMPQFDWVLIDECQDLSAAQRELFLKCIKPDGRFIAVGDPKQAIYGFAGADIDSFNKLGQIPNTRHFPLSICYRCDKSIVELVKNLVPQIEAHPNAPLGKVDREVKMEMVKDGDAILCRNTAPLASLCMEYIANGIKAYIKGRDIGANLISMVNKTNTLKIKDALTVFDVEVQKVATKVAKLKNCNMAEAMTSKQVEFYMDKVEVIEILGEGLIYCSDLVDRIASIFSDKNSGGICLSTVHKAKGLEYDNVFIVCKEKFYHPRSMEVPWMAEQEKNIVYVAYTRAKHYLGFITDFEYDKR